MNISLNKHIYINISISFQYHPLNSPQYFVSAHLQSYLKKISSLSLKLNIFIQLLYRKIYKIIFTNV